MKFNYDKFMAATNNSSYYSNWDESLLELLKSVECPFPHCNSHEYIFSMEIERGRTKNGRHRQGIFVSIVCPNVGKVRIKLDSRINPDEIGLVTEKIVGFLYNMKCAGFIE